MTSFVAWTGVDARGPASLYLASDSRISWPGGDSWDCGKKVFASSAHPDLLGYVGDVLFPSLALNQLISAIDEGLLYARGSAPSARLEQVENAVARMFQDFPADRRQPFSILYGTREGGGMGSIFHLWALTWSKSLGWATKQFPAPTVSSNFCVLGSGSSAVGKWQDRWDGSGQGGTSRAIFSALCDALADGQDAKSGGAPQLVVSAP